MKRLSIFLAAATLAATQSFAATISYDFSDAPSDVRFNGVSVVASDSFSATVSDTASGQVSIVVNNLDTAHKVTAVFFNGLKSNVFETAGAVMSYSNKRFAKALGVKKGTQYNIKLRNGNSFEILTTAASGLTAEDFKDVELGFLAFKPKSKSSSVFAATASTPIAVRALPAPAPVPLPAGVVLLGSGLALLGMRGRKSRKAS
ncbi:MAG: hypothetical protein ABJQ34_15305 [Paracoccaceae bacterium]